MAGSLIIFRRFWDFHDDVDLCLVQEQLDKFCLLRCQIYGFKTWQFWRTVEGFQIRALPKVEHSKHWQLWHSGQAAEAIAFTERE